MIINTYLFLLAHKSCYFNKTNLDGGRCLGLKGEAIALVLYMLTPFAVRGVSMHDPK